MKKILIIALCALIGYSINAQQAITETSVLYIIKSQNNSSEFKTYNLVLSPQDILSLDVLSKEDSQSKYDVAKGTVVMKVLVKSTVQLINSTEVKKKYSISDKYYGLKFRLDGRLLEFDFLADVNEIKSVSVNTQDNCIDLISKTKSSSRNKVKKGEINIR
jgi:hypothetical protein